MPGQVGPQRVGGRPAHPLARVGGPDGQHLLDHGDGDEQDGQGHAGAAASEAPPGGAVDEAPQHLGPGQLQGDAAQQQGPQERPPAGAGGAGRCTRAGRSSAGTALAPARTVDACSWRRSEFQAGPRARARAARRTGARRGETGPGEGGEVYSLGARLRAPETASPQCLERLSVRGLGTASPEKPLPTPSVLGALRGALRPRAAGQTPPLSRAEAQRSAAA